MSLRYLLDTNIISDTLRRPRGPVAGRIAEVGEDSICTRIVVPAEHRYAAEKLQSKQLSERVELLLSALEIRPLAARQIIAMHNSATSSRGKAPPSVQTIC
jgi:tRNA(fMet)-specific endonuclease VapC